MSSLLVVDDEPAIQNAFRHVFRDSRFTLSLANTPADAMAMIASQKPDGAVLDIHLPNATWLDLLHQIGAREMHVPVVLITGAEARESAVETLKNVAHDCLLRPLMLPHLRELIDQALQSSNLTRVPVLIPEADPRPAEPCGGFDWDQFISSRIAAQHYDVYAASLERMEREVLVRVLRHTNGNQLQAAKILGITRGTLRSKIRSLGIYFNRVVWSNDGRSES